MLNDQTTAQVAVSVAKEVYSDAVGPVMREFGKIGVNAAKVVHLVLFPLQYGAKFQDRLAQRLQEALERVPSARRMAPRESIALPVGERLRYEDEGINPIADLYINLLARAMDKERVGEAHPAFLSIIGQLAPDELLVLRQLEEQEYRVFVRLGPGEPALLFPDACAKLDGSGFWISHAEKLRHAAVRPEELAQPLLFLTFFGHLQSLGLTEYTNIPKQALDNISSPGFEYHCIKLTDFGRLFLSACVLESSKVVESQCNQGSFTQDG